MSKEQKTLKITQMIRECVKDRAAPAYFEVHWLPYLEIVDLRTGKLKK